MHGRIEHFKCNTIDECGFHNKRLTMSRQNQPIVLNKINERSACDLHMRRFNDNFTSYYYKSVYLRAKENNTSER